MKFTAILDEYVILKLELDKYRGTEHSLEEGFHIASGRLGRKARKMERELLESYFTSWAAPYYGRLRGWRADSPVYLMLGDSLVGGMYLCDQNEYEVGSGWGQLHYTFMDPEFKGRKLFNVNFNATIEKARNWGLKGVIISTDRHMIPDIMIRWGAVPWKTVKKTDAPNRQDLSEKRLLSSLRVKIASLRNEIKWFL